MKFSSFLRRFFRRKKEVQPAAQESPSRDHAARLLQMVEQTTAEEYDCEQVYDLLDEFAERVARGEDASQLMPLVDQHLHMCADCREEYEALLRVLKEGKQS